VTTVPCPQRLRMAKLPLWRATIDRTRASPKPLPSTIRAALPRYNSSPRWEVHSSTSAAVLPLDLSYIFQKQFNLDKMFGRQLTVVRQATQAAASVLPYQRQRPRKTGRLVDRAAWVPASLPLAQQHCPIHRLSHRSRPRSASLCRSASTGQAITRFARSTGGAAKWSAGR
jgi:hypothetical protein